MSSHSPIRLRGGEDEALADEPRDYSIAEAAALLGLSPATVRRRIREGTLEASKIRGAHGDEYRVELADVPLALGRGPFALEAAGIVELLKDQLRDKAQEVAAKDRQIEEGIRSLVRLQDAKDREIADLRARHEYLRGQLEELRQFTKQLMEWLKGRNSLDGPRDEVEPA